MFELIQRYQSTILWILAVLLLPLFAVRIRKVFEDYKKALRDEYLFMEREYNELVAHEGIIYDRQLKINKKLSEISSLYEITRDMSRSLRFSDIFRILAEYMQKNFTYKKLQLVLVEVKDEPSFSNIVYESYGMQDYSLAARGIFPGLKVSSRPLSGHDRKIYGLLKDDIRRLQIIKTRWGDNPYAEFLPEGAQTYMVVPIVIENYIVGILAIEDLPASDLEKFSILSSQFGLEARRIILYEKVGEMAITDGLTKAFAKRYILERLKEEFDRSRRHNFQLSFAMADIDYFKKCNDTYGHLVGDIVLKDIVSILKENTREVDLVGRFGGEEFCLVLPETKKSEAMLVAERIREIVGRYNFKAYDELINVTISIGIASYPEDAADADELIENSDKTLYLAKNQGRNRVCTYNPAAR